MQASCQLSFDQKTKNSKILNATLLLNDRLRFAHPTHRIPMSRPWCEQNLSNIRFRSAVFLLLLSLALIQKPRKTEKNKDKMYPLSSQFHSHVPSLSNFQTFSCAPKKRNTPPWSFPQKTKRLNRLKETKLLAMTLTLRLHVFLLRPCLYRAIKKHQRRPRCRDQIEPILEEVYSQA